MKAIAEYFRDLAADDRYFGAEPPTPDADMLARIAEREIERRVDARFDGENVVLRASETAPAAAAALASEAVETAAEALDEPAPAPVEKPVEEVVEASEETPVANIEAETVATDVEEVAPSADTTDANDAADDDAIAAFMAETPVEDVVEVETPVIETPTPVVHPDADSIAAKLQRIRAVVAPGEDNDDSIFTEDQHADPMEEAPADVIAEVDAESIDVEEDFEETAQTLDAEAEPIVEVVEAEPIAQVEEKAYDEEVEADDVDISAVMSALSEEETPADESTVEAEADEPVEADAEEPAQGRVFKVKSTALEAALAADAEATETAAADEDLDAEDAQDTAEADDIDMSIFEEDDSDDADSDLSPEEEAELMAELAEVARDTEAETAQDRDGAAILASLDDPEPAIDRIMEKTNDALETPENGRKREAISHLKAAVAATEADRKLNGEETQSEDQTESYREDLAQVVRPKRATPIASTRTRPTRPAAPLKLVAEQRVDTTTADAAAPSSPVRPRRISKTQAATQDSEGGFAEFAQSAGASELPDLLEAAAAYTAYVEGRENFTRPQVMRRAAAVAGKDGFSREDGLRSFGQLLREGKINKLSRGQFVVSEETRFRPNARIAGE
ncbi:MAG: hypothetical protein AAGK92_09375 [Pseudomonadota bacterium]